MDIIKFEGAWTDRDKRIVRDVVNRAEKVLNLDVPDSLMGKRWLCRCELEDGRPTFIASRVNLDYAFTGGTLTELAKDLLTMAGEKRRQAPLSTYWNLSEHQPHRTARREDRRE